MIYWNVCYTQLESWVPRRISLRNLDLTEVNVHETLEVSITPSHCLPVWHLPFYEPVCMSGSNIKINKWINTLES